VPETWFFRDREAFVALAKLALERLALEPARVLRILSAPCSTGEEPYSISMALLDAGIDATRFAIDAIDISARSIEFARCAVYGRNSFRGSALTFRERHFSEAAQGWVPNERVRQPVRFALANLFEAPTDSALRYDFIFCRNVLIYFDREAQDRAIRLLDTRLAEGGTIFVGPAETGLMMRNAMRSAHIPLAFAFHRMPPDGTGARGCTHRPGPGALGVASPGTAFALQTGTATRRATPLPSAKPTSHRSKAMPQNATRRHAPLGAPPVSPPDTRTPRLASAALEDAERLADAGRLDEAERASRALVLEHGPHADAFYLLGLIADARGRSSEAGDFYRKALYLEPTHYEALTHLATLVEATGDKAGAQQLMQRARRAVMGPNKDKTAHLSESGKDHGSRR
jgi:chemotaxis protein methyltransferase WspC